MRWTLPVPSFLCKVRPLATGAFGRGSRERGKIGGKKRVKVDRGLSREWLKQDRWDKMGPFERILSQHQEDHGVYPWVNWSSGAGCSPEGAFGVVPRACPWGSILKEAETVL
jgi:hypothetical protein